MVKNTHRADKIRLSYSMNSFEWFLKNGYNYCILEMVVKNRSSTPVAIRGRQTWRSVLMFTVVKMKSNRVIGDTKVIEN